jgi:DNA-binding MarR family transcriptional regulator
LAATKEEPLTIGHDAAVELFSSLSELIRTSRALAHRSKDLGATGTALGVLKTLRDQDARPGDLATALHVVPSVISRTIAPLEQEGLVERKVDPLDARASLLGLTTLGRERLSQVQQVYVRQLRQTFDSWTDEEAEQAVTLLARLDDALSTYSQSDSHRRQLSEALLNTPEPMTPEPMTPEPKASAPTATDPHHREQVSA